MKRLSYFLLTILISCTNVKKEDTNHSEDTTEIKPNAEFLSFIDMLPPVPLPFEVNCEKCCGHAKLDYENELVKKFWPKGSAIVGVLGKTDKHIIVLVTYPGYLLVPSIKIFDMEGKIVNEQNFMTSYCGGDEDFYSSQFFAINGDLTITTSDTVFNLIRDTITYKAIDTTSIEITVQNFRISHDGVIVRTDSVKNTIN